MHDPSLTSDDAWRRRYRGTVRRREPTESKAEDILVYRTPDPVPIHYAIVHAGRWLRRAIYPRRTMSCSLRDEGQNRVCRSTK
jgi:hypothetical protein